MAAQSLVDAGVVAVLGSYSSGLTLAGSDVLAEAQIPALTATSTNPTVTLLSDWYARICFIDPFQGTMLARFAVENGYHGTDKSLPGVCREEEGPGTRLFWWRMTTPSPGRWSPGPCPSAGRYSWRRCATLPGCAV